MLNMLTGNELRKKFLQFFASKNHLILPSYSLIPENDPTLLLIGAGMAPFKPFFTGKMKPPHPRISTSQKCVRTGDIENVGRTARHHTFFEMLGNFSFGDYFKKEAISWAWEFLTKELELPKERLWVTIHTEDDEAYAIWTNDIGVLPERIIRMEDNFWEIGPGPCGPCSEIYVDLGEDRGCGNPDCGVGCDCDRYLEIWNLVFTQYDRDEEGNYTPLAKKNIDTGAGLERIASVLQNKKSNFETDLIFPIIEHTAKLAGVVYGQSSKTDVSLKVIADHARSMTVMVADGILPSNEGRGYVLRRILRRAVRHAKLMGIDKLFLADIVDVVINIFAEPYPDLFEKKDYIKKVIQMEEERFNETLTQGMELLNEHIGVLERNGKKVLDGQTVFKLYDTFGLPWELTQEILDEHGISFDKESFDLAMKEQRDRARAARQDIETKVIIPDLSGLVREELKYDEKAEEAKILLMLQNGEVITKAHENQEIAVILNVTSFYAEGGGQVGDTGVITAPLGKFTVTDTKKLPDGTRYHIGVVEEGIINTNDTVQLELNSLRRKDTARNHTATHLLQAALKRVLGTHVNQAGSFVGPDRLRFDFSHFAPVTERELAQVERIVNEAVLSSIPVAVIETTQELAKEMGAMALFGEKYGKYVRVVMAGDFSKELCGGIHVANTSEIGLFKIVGETGIGSGSRRIEAVTGCSAHEYINSQEKLLMDAAALLKSRPDDIVSRIDGLLGHIKSLEHDLDIANNKLAKSYVEELMDASKEIDGLQIVVGQVVVQNIEDLRSTADLVRSRMHAGIIVLGAVHDDKVNFVAMCVGDAVARGIHAGNIVKEVAKIAGGGGGGRADMAQAGGKHPEKTAEALNKVIDIVQNQMK